MFRLASRALHKGPQRLTKQGLHNSSTKRFFSSIADSVHSQTYEDPWTIRRICGALFCGGGMVLTAGLCEWQLRRRKWKKGLLRERKEQMRQVPSTLDDILTSYASAEHRAAGAPVNAPLTRSAVSESMDKLRTAVQYRSVSVEGFYDYSKEQFVGPAAPPTDAENCKRGELQRGYYVITPMRLAEPTSISFPVTDKATGAVIPSELQVREVLVNRGWVSASSILTYMNARLPERNPVVDEADRLSWWGRLMGRREPVVPNTTRGILWFGQAAPKGEFPIIDIKNTGTPGFQFSTAAVLALAMKISPITLSIPGTNPIETGRADLTDRPALALEKKLPIFLVDATDLPPSARLPAVDAELTSPSVRMTLSRKSATDFNNFHTMPETHAAYAFTWGALSITLAYILMAKFVRGGVSSKLRKAALDAIGNK